MSVLTSNILTKNLTDLIGFGATLNNDGSVATITGATFETGAAIPTATRNAGSVYLRTNGTIYTTPGGGVWIAGAAASALATVAESADVSNVEAVFAGGSAAIPSSLSVGIRIAFTALVRVSAVSGTPTARVRLRIGGLAGTLAFDTTGRTVADEDLISIDGYLDIRSTGAPGSATGVAVYRISAADALASAVASEWAQDVAGSAAGTWAVALTTTSATSLDITGQTDAAGTTLRLESFRVSISA